MASKPKKRIGRSLFHFDLAIDWSPFARCFGKPPVQKVRFAIGLKTPAPAPAPQLVRAQAKKRGGLQPTEPRRFATAQNAHQLEHALQLVGLRSGALQNPERLGVYRTDRALPKLDIGCDADTG
ncbi:hypothetical protein [uncultured Rhodoblastus sp.]|uniref:hypothetical protein n=1 Tax=uncultured Rhodoblastus sp. TaxID=543037 RepID=UPI0025EC7F2C|nr:hypothetical protein [uncultured Rhodoblastus sp.]